MPSATRPPRWSRMRVVATVAVETLTAAEAGTRRAHQSRRGRALSPAHGVRRRPGARHAALPARQAQGGRPGDRACPDRSAQFDHHRPAGLCRDRPGLWRYADPHATGAAGHDRQRRPHQPAGDRRRAAFDRRADGQRALPNELFLDHPREPGSRRRAVRPRLQYAVRIQFHADAYRLAAGLSARHREDGTARGVEAWRLRHPQPPLLRRQPFARHRHRHAGVFRRRAGRFFGQHGAPCRHRRGHARAGDRHSRTCSPKACCSTG